MKVYNLSWNLEELPELANAFDPNHDSTFTPGIISYSNLFAKY